MPGGLLKLVSEGAQNIILNGNPTRSFWKASYSKYTNFGTQNFRVDYEGTPTLRLTEESVFTFKMPRYADLLNGCYLSIALPNIWSPIYPPQKLSENLYSDWVPYEFKWIDNLGSQMISKITINCGNQKIQEYSGQYILSCVQRDFDVNKKDLFNEMTGNVPELNDPANNPNSIYGGGVYPNSFYTDNPGGSEPSIRDKILYIPLNSWFSLKTQMAFPLVALQYNELSIKVHIRPINELFKIRDVTDAVNGYPYVAPNFNQQHMQFYRFLQTPPDTNIDENTYIDKRTIWNADINLNCTYVFLGDEEQKVFARNEQKYLIKQVHEHKFYNVTGTNKVKLDSLGLVSSWMYYFQRSDVNLRNEWSNYTNWIYNTKPNDLVAAPTDSEYINPSNTSFSIGPGLNIDGTPTDFMITGNYSVKNQKEILKTMGILFDGAYCENMLPAGVFNYIEKYTRTAGFAESGLYCYNFCENTSPFELQPSGAINMNKFLNVELEFVTIVPPLDPLAQSLSICDPQTNEIIGINKQTWQIYDYNYNLTLFEERYNMVTFAGGNCGLMYAT